MNIASFGKGKRRKPATEGTEAEEVQTEDNFATATSVTETPVEHTLSAEESVNADEEELQTEEDLATATSVTETPAEHTLPAEESVNADEEELQTEDNLVTVKSVAAMLSREPSPRAEERVQGLPGGEKRSGIGACCGLCF